MTCKIDYLYSDTYFKNIIKVKYIIYYGILKMKLQIVYTFI